jgi:inner membrane protein involved in colicin E2 resistance
MEFMKRSRVHPSLIVVGVGLAGFVAGRETLTEHSGVYVAAVVASFVVLMIVGAWTIKR